MFKVSVLGMSPSLSQKAKERYVDRRGCFLLEWIE